MVFSFAVLKSSLSQNILDILKNWYTIGLRNWYSVNMDMLFNCTDYSIRYTI